jgi:hypothetical protein
MENDERQILEALAKINEEQEKLMGSLLILGEAIRVNCENIRKAEAYRKGLVEKLCELRKDPVA